LPFLTNFVTYFLIKSGQRISGIDICGRHGSGSSALALPMWSKLERATVGSYFAALRNTAKQAPTTSGRAVAMAWDFVGWHRSRPKTTLSFSFLLLTMHNLANEDVLLATCRISRCHIFISN